MLLLKRHLVALVKAGKKHQTIRLWTRPLLRPGQVSYTPGLGKMKITSVEELPNLQALTHEDALADGFPNLPALLHEIHKIYGRTLPPTRRLYRIRFQWPLLDRHPTPNPADSVGAGRSTPAPPFTTGNIKTHRQHLASPIPNQNSKIKTQKSPSPQLAQRHALRSYILAHAPAKKP